MVWIENKRGRIKQRAKLSEDVQRQVVAADAGWWFPENLEENLLFSGFGNRMSISSLPMPLTTPVRCRAVGTSSLSSARFPKSRSKIHP
jgi:anaerobic selenocysteine-containing dehydrogenase